MDQWKYLSVRARLHNGSLTDQSTEVVRGLGEEGWELVSAVPVTMTEDSTVEAFTTAIEKNAVLLYFKRAVSPGQPGLPSTEQIESPNRTDHFVRSSTAVRVGTREAVAVL